MEAIRTNTHRSRRPGWPALLAAVIWLNAAATPRAMAHETDPIRPTAAELALTQPALPGGETFARALLAHSAGWMTEKAADRVDLIAAHLASTDSIRDGRMAAPPAEAEYHRWRAEQALESLVTSAPGVVQVDFRTGVVAAPEGPIVVGTEGLLLAAVRLPGDGVGFSVHEMDLTSERDEAAYTARVQAHGITYLLLKLGQVPAGPLSVILRLARPGENRASLFARLEIAPEPVGQLALTITDERGRNVPALVRLTSARGKRLLQPAGAVDLGPMMNQVTGLPIYGPDRGYPVWLPLRWQGRYWVVPGPFDMAVPAGDWEVDVIRGPEFEPVHRVVSVPARGRSRNLIRLKRWVSMAARGWYSGDDHVHSRLMSSEDADKLMAFTKAIDLNICNVLEMGDSARTWYAQRGFGPEFRVKDGSHWLVPGQEDPRSQMGHAIGLNLRSRVRDRSRYLLNDWIAEEIHKQGGLYGHTHVGSGVPELMTEREMALFTPMGVVDFSSVMQAGLGTELYYDFLNMGFRITATAGSDTPYGGTVGAVRTYAYCGSGRFTPDAWFRAVRSGRTMVSNGVMVDLVVDGLKPGASIEVRRDRPLQVRARAFGLPGQWAPKRLEIIWLGDVVRSADASGKPGADLTISATIPAGFGGWLVAHAVGEDGSEALTSPVYVTRPGFRGWNAARADGLIRRQLQVLDGISRSVDEAVRSDRPALPVLDINQRQMVAQAPLLRERLERTRGIYTALLATLERERVLRQPQAGRR